MSLAEELQKRGFIHQISGESLAEIVDGPKRVIYHGVDPTADSIQAGNFAAWMLLRHLVNAGHTVILLIGGGTGMIGDPKPDVERPLTPPEVIAARVEKLQKQAALLLGTDTVRCVNNYEWLGPLKLIDFLRDIGKHFTVNELIKKDAIATRLHGEHGISYTEFAYPLLQGYDYLELNRQYNCDVQVGGSDQWGNIIAGVELVRKKLQKTVYAITIPLIVDKVTGKKLGKSEGNSVWLDAEKTSPFLFYQFWLNTADGNVADHLKIFTLLPLTEIEELLKEHQRDPAARLAQKKLAFEITQIVHGKETTQVAVHVSEILFGDRSLQFTTTNERAVLKDAAPHAIVKKGETIISILVATGLAASNREARTFVESGAVTLNGEKITDTEAVLREEQCVHQMALLRRGKKQIVVLDLGGD